MIDARLQVMAAEVTEIDDKNIEMAFALASVLPLPGGQALPFQTGVVRIPLSKESAQSVMDQIQAAIKGEEYVPPKEQNSDLIVAQDLKAVEKLAAMDQKLKAK